MGAPLEKWVSAALAAEESTEGVAWRLTVSCACGRWSPWEQQTWRHTPRPTREHGSL